MSDDQAQMTADPALNQNTEDQGITIDTPRAVEVTSQPSGMVHEEAQTTSPEVDAQPKSEEDKPEVHAEAPEDKRVANKVSQLERERNANRKEREEAEKRLANLDSWLRNKPDVYRDALIETAGYTKEQADEAVRALKQQVKEAETQPQVAQGSFPVNIQEEVAKAYQREEENRVKLAEVNAFISKHPEMDPKNISPTELPLIRNIAIGVEERAYQIMDESSLEGKAVSRSEAMEQAYTEFKALSSREVAKAREQGEIEGMAKSNAINSAVIRSGTVSGQGAAPTVSLTPEEASIASATGMTPEEYATWRDKDAIVS